MAAGERDGTLNDFFDVVEIIERIGNFGGNGRNGNSGGFGIVLVEDKVIFGSLVLGDVGFGVQIISVIWVNVEVVWF